MRYRNFLVSALASAVPLTAAVVAVVLSSGSPARAQMTFHADLTHAQETTTGTLLTSTGDPRPLSFGTATFVLSADMTSFTMNVDVFNIDVTGSQTPLDTNDNLVNAHIHAGAPPGSNAPVRWGFFGSPDNDNNPDDLVVTPFVGQVGGNFVSKWDAPEGNSTTLAAQINNIVTGQAYINFHTVQFAGGEIRGQILADAPESGTIALVLCGLSLASATVAVRAYRRRRPRHAAALRS